MNAGTILIIESNDADREMLGRYIGQMGYDYKATAGGAQGLQDALLWRPELIILDLFLPDIPGIEVLKQIKEETETGEIPVLLLSSDTSEEITVVGLSTGALDLLHKPIRMAELAAKIENALELARSRRQLNELNAKLEKEKKRLLKYFSHDIVEKILTEEIAAELGGSNLTASILFFDVRGSTHIAERIDPMEFAEFISLLFNDVMELIFQNGGSVNKLMGDGILATFGCPVPAEQDAQNSVNCALGICEYMKTFNSFKPHYVPEEISYGIGIASGTVFAGNVGSARRMEYTVMGDPVNVAARLQALTRKTRVNILIDKNTRMRLGSEIKVARVVNARIRGHESEIQIFAVKG